MSKKMYRIISGIVAVIATLATAIVTAINPPAAPAIVSAIGIAAGAVNEILNLFVIDDGVSVAKKEKLKATHGD